MKKMKNGMSNVIKNIDMFGHPIEFNFNKRGTKHNTIVGGFVSIFIRSFLLFYVIYIFSKMFSYGVNIERNSTFTLVSDGSSE